MSERVVMREAEPPCINGKQHQWSEEREISQGIGPELYSSQCAHCKVIRAIDFLVTVYANPED